MNQFISDLKGVFLTPGQTIAGVMERKKWVPPLVLVVFTATLLSYMSYPIIKVEQAKMIRGMAVADKMSEEQLDNLDKFTPAKRINETLFQIPIQSLKIIVAAFFIYLFFKLGGAEGFYVNFFTGACYASLIDMGVGAAVKTVLILLKKSILVSTSLTLFFPGLEIRSPAYAMLSQFDLFSIWFLVALALGIAIFSKMKLFKSLGIASAYFVFRSIIVVLFTLLMMRMWGA
jgi:hypothetical protein